jgi:DnaJ homolog subfamily B member 12
VRACKVTEYYEILAVKKDCEEADVKKAYRKVSCRVTAKARRTAKRSCNAQLALALHPDKNGAPGADEAFKSASSLREDFLISLT